MESKDNKFASANLLPNEEGDAGGYDEDQWEATLADMGSRSQSEDGIDPLFGGESDDSKQPTDQPELDELLKKIPQKSQDLIDSLFRGQFKSVKLVDRKKLY